MGHALWSVNIDDTGLGLQRRPSWSRVNESKVVTAINRNSANRPIGPTTTTPKVTDDR